MQLVCESPCQRRCGDGAWSGFLQKGLGLICSLPPPPVFCRDVRAPRSGQEEAGAEEAQVRGPDHPLLLRDHAPRLGAWPQGRERGRRRVGSARLGAGFRTASSEAGKKNNPEVERGDQVLEPRQKDRAPLELVRVPSNAHVEVSFAVVGGTRPSQDGSQVAAPVLFQGG